MRGPPEGCASRQCPCGVSVWPPEVPPSPQLPWKSLTSIIEYYYMWKTTDRYVQQVGSRAGRPLRAAGGDRGTPLPPEHPPRLPADLSVLPFSLQKRLKAAEAESKLKQVYIPN